MNQTAAELLAKIVGGTAYNSGGNHWLVMIYRPDGRLVVYGDTSVALYHSFAAWENGDAAEAVEW